MTLSDTSNFIVNLLKQWLPNKSTLSKITESNDGVMLFNGEEIKGEVVNSIGNLYSNILWEGSVGTNSTTTASRNTITLTDSFYNYDKIGFHSNLFATTTPRYRYDEITIEELDKVINSTIDNSGAYFFYGGGTTDSHTGVHKSNVSNGLNLDIGCKNGFVTKVIGIKIEKKSNNPIGEVISYIGTTAPQDFLICDGSIYNIADYPQLAEHILTQFGEYGYLGGDGITTFAVPDMRGLFTRGFGGASGAIGIKQNGTEIPNIRVPASTNSVNVPRLPVGATVNTNIDEVKSQVTTRLAANTSFTPYTITAEVEKDAMVTIRPDNMAVLYCIRYQ